MKTVTVKASWMKACGYPEVDTVMEVISDTVKTAGGETMYKVINPITYQEWVVAAWRLTC